MVQGFQSEAGADRRNDHDLRSEARPERDDASHPALTWVLSGLVLAVVLELISTFFPFTSSNGKLVGEGCSTLAALLFSATCLTAIYQVRQMPKVFTAVAAGMGALVFTQALKLLATFPALAAIKEAYIYDVLRDASSIAAIALMGGGFFLCVFDLVASKRRLEKDSRRLAEEIDERKEVEATLRDSKERYSLMFEGTQEGIVLVNEYFQIIQFNTRFAQMFGYSPGQLRRIDPLSLIHPEDRPQVIDKHRRRMAGEAVGRTVEFRMHHRNGDERWVLGSFDLIKRRDEILCTHVMLNDITQRKQAQEALLFRLQLESIISVTSSNFISSDIDQVDDNISQAMKALGEFTGADRAYIFSFDVKDGAFKHIANTHEWCADGVTPQIQNLQDVPYTDYPDTFGQLLQRQVYTVPSVAALDHADPAKAGFQAQDIRSLYVVPMVFENKIVGCLGLDFTRAETAISDDILVLLRTIGEIIAGAQSRKETMAALRDKEEKYRNILRSIVEGYYEFDLQGTLQFFNDRVPEILRYKPEDLQGIHVSKLYDERTLGLVNSINKSVAETGESFSAIELPLLRADGSTVYIEASGALVRDGQGRQTGFRGIFRDVTERRQADEERRQLEGQMQHAQKLESLGVLAGGIAHDFNNLLMGVLANASLANQDLDEHSPTGRCLRQIELSAQRAADLANQMLTYSGKGTFTVRPLDVSALVEEMAHLLEVSTSKKARFVYMFDRSLPAIEGDATQLRQVVMNLITNASDALGEESGIIEVQTGAIDAGEAEFEDAYFNYTPTQERYVFLEVRDTGCGMDAATKERIFDPFFTSKFTGRGLGLAAVMGIIRGHRGAVKVDSERGKGTAFRVYFPASAQAKPAALEHSPATTSATGEGTILVADDEALILDVTERILSKAGYTVLTAQDGEECLALFHERRHEIDAVLLDMTMPKLGGAEAFLAIGDIAPEVPVILSSGFNEQEASAKFGGRKPAGFLQKPYRAADLVAAIHQVLEARETAAS
ncbi:MAG: PAS domain S-box protein [Candidatus Hydrogenedentales bacterium]